GGSRPLQDIIPWSVRTIASLKFLKIIFLSQITAAGEFLFAFKDLGLKSHRSRSGRTISPTWFNTLQKLTLQNPVQSNRLKPEFHNETLVLSGYDNLSIDDLKWNRGWATLWTPPNNNLYNFPIPGCSLFGKLFKLSSPAPPCLFQHFEIINVTNDPRSPSKRNNYLSPCSGCSFNQPRGEFPIKPKLKKLSCAAFVDPMLPNPIA
ncbi:19162_t:CDS:1, partial [Funneliformis geosporum]